MANKIARESYNPTLYTELKPDPEAVTEDKLVIPPPIITYKYPDDPKFYKADEIEKKFRTF